MATSPIARFLTRLFPSFTRSLFAVIPRFPGFRISALPKHDGFVVRNKVLTIALNVLTKFSKRRWKRYIYIYWIVMHLLFLSILYYSQQCSRTVSNLV